MFNRFFGLALILALVTTQSFAVTATGNGLKSALDELSYTMDVEGAALSPEAKQEAISRFAQSLSDLRAQGMTNQEMISFVQSQIQDKKVAQETAAQYALLQTNNLSQEQVQGILKNLASRMYAKGASWNGDSSLPTIGIIVGLLVLVVGLALLSGKDPCANEAYARGNPSACESSWYNGAYYNI
jgi:hypothetical protein